ncbi:hypothetical protein JB92DRAFT_2830237 [Gautieria morchelliformis]|nr:hypothetical protein JB92DRAFT_2830237 [Gautieria morchelliformis]
MTGDRQQMGFAMNFTTGEPSQPQHQGSTHFNPEGADNWSERAGPITCRSLRGGRSRKERLIRRRARPQNTAKITNSNTCSALKCADMEFALTTDLKEEEELLQYYLHSTSSSPGSHSVACVGLAQLILHLYVGLWPLSHVFREQNPKRDLRYQIGGGSNVITGTNDNVTWDMLEYHDQVDVECSPPPLAMSETIVASSASRACLWSFWDVSRRMVLTCKPACNSHFQYASSMKNRYYSCCQFPPLAPSERSGILTAVTFFRQAHGGSARTVSGHASCINYTAVTRST